MSFYYFLMSRLFFREREKKGKKLISVFDRQFETQKLMQKIERQTQRERKNIMSKNTFKIAQESPTLRKKI